jgi:hypothetical protein
MELKIASFILKPKTEPLFSEQATTISVDDEAAGAFVVIKQDGRNDNSVRIDFSEWDMLTEAVRKLQQEWDVKL